MATAVLLAGLVGLTGCGGVKHTIGEPSDEENGAASDGRAPATGPKEMTNGPAPRELDEPPGAPETRDFLEASGTDFGNVVWAAEVHREGKKVWLTAPYDPAFTFAAVRAGTVYQGLPLRSEDFDARTLATDWAYHDPHPEGESGFALFMRVLFKGFGKDTLYRFDIAVEPGDDGGSRVVLSQERQVVEETWREDVGEWVPGEPEPDITAAFAEGLRKALGPVRPGAREDLDDKLGDN